MYVFWINDLVKCTRTCLQCGYLFDGLNLVEKEGVCVHAFVCLYLGGGGGGGGEEIVEVQYVLPRNS